LRRSALLWILAVIFTASTWIYVQYVLVAHQRAAAATKGIPRGNLSDLYPRWLGARELLLHGRNPYRDDITREIQIGYYGRVLDASRPNDPKDQQAFAYPIYVVLMIAPTVSLPFATVSKFVFWIFAVLTALSVPLWLRTLGWRISLSRKIAWTLLTLGWFPVVQGLRLQQLTVLVAALVALGMSAIVGRRLVLAGVLLAAATIKPQLVFLLPLWLCLWATGNWRERQRIVWSFCVTVAVLVAVGEWLVPGWIREFRTALGAYYTYTGGAGSMLDVLLSKRVGSVVSLILVSVFLSFAWRVRRARETTAEFQWVCCFLLATTLLVIPSFGTYNQILLLPACMILLRGAKNSWHRGWLQKTFLAIVAGSLFWSYLAASLLAVALLFLPGTTVQRAWGLPLYLVFAVPILIYATLLVVRKDLLREPDGATDRLPALQPNAAAE